MARLRKSSKKVESAGESIDISSEIKKLTRIHRDAETRALKLFKSGTKDFFNKNPVIKSVIWHHCPHVGHRGDGSFCASNPVFTNARVGTWEAERFIDCSHKGKVKGKASHIWAATYAELCSNKIATSVPFDLESLENMDCMISDWVFSENTLNETFGSFAVVVLTPDGHESSSFHPEHGYG